MAIRTYTPGLSVTLHKTITYQNGTAQRYQASQRSIDLTPLPWRRQLHQDLKERLPA